MTALALVLAVIAVGELTMFALVRLYRRSFPWLITRGDEAPALGPDVVQAHADRSFDALLGWCRRPGEHGTEVTADGTVTFSVDALGRRTEPGHADGAPAPIACFGDSFTFCRLVGDDETWPHHLSLLTGVNVANYGVGNYGLDQALLRLERELPGLDADIVIMGVVPETIARVQSAWKHYFEYGNTLAFKPRFTLGPDGLVLHPSVIRRPEDYFDYRRHLPALREIDPFYRRKFRADQLGFPYLPKLVRRFRRHLPILFHLTAGRIGRSPDGGFRRAFEVVVAENHRLASRLYREDESTALLAALVRRFADVCAAAGKAPVLAILPQPADLVGAVAAHEDFVRSLSAVLPVIDLTPAFRAESDRTALYAEGKLGPHASDHGNRIIARTLAERVPALRSMLAAEGAHAEKERK
ncbi:hypothetical protein [Streptomyces puniciscabiei]|uniref:hypothetical protein n=1 Tax=Streptomyces puniciscabiei TaxID=164348 RepID=UPI00332FD4C6